MYLYSISSKQKSVTLFMTFTSLLLKIMVHNMKKRNVFLDFNLRWTRVSWRHDIGLQFYKKIALHFLATASMSPTALYGFLSFLTWYNLSYSKPLASINFKYYWVTLKVISLSWASHCWNQEYFSCKSSTIIWFIIFWRSLNSF